MRMMKRAALTTGLALGFSLAAAAASADDFVPEASMADDGNPLAAWQGMDSGDMDANRGGAEPFSLASQVNNAHLEGTNSGSISIGPGASMATGAITGTSLIANHGTTTVMQNTGDLVNMNYSMNVNVYLQ